MDSINRHLMHERIALVYDTMAGAQLQGNGIKKYVKALREAVGLKDPNAANGDQFLRDFGRGI